MLAEIFVMRLVNVQQLIEQGIVGGHGPQRFVGNLGQFLIENEKDQVALILRIVEQSSEADVGTPGDLPERGRVVSMSREKFPRGGTNALAFLQLFFLPQPKPRRRNTHILYLNMPSSLPSPPGWFHPASEPFES